ncbi:MAG: copper amine oxidase N-terminal domain-containing protein [Clostridia bacterium]|nr:copper amine oxidase N-terminal domain-containing protein [Clostridia bacterium]
MLLRFKQQRCFLVIVGLLVLTLVLTILPQGSFASENMAQSFIKEAKAILKVNYETHKKYFSYDNTWKIFNRYYLYDIDKNGVPELLVQEGSCEADFVMVVYKYANNKLVKIGKISSGHSSFYTYPEANGIILHMCHMGGEQITIYSIVNNSIKKEQVFDGYFPDSPYVYYGAEQEYKPYVEGSRAVPWAYVNDYSLLNDYFNMDANSEIKVYICGGRVKFDVSPVVESGRILVPVRAIFEEALSGTVTWNEATDTVLINRYDDNISITVGSKTALVNNVKHTLDVPARKINNRVLVPLRFVGEQLGRHVEWVKETKEVYLE